MRHLQAVIFENTRWIRNIFRQKFYESKENIRWYHWF